MAHFKRSLKYNIKEELMRYREELDSLNFLIKAVIKLNSKLYKLAMETHSSNSNSKTRFYLEYASYCSRKPKTNR